MGAGVVVVVVSWCCCTVVIMCNVTESGSGKSWEG